MAIYRLSCITFFIFLNILTVFSPEPVSAQQQKGYESLFTFLQTAVTHSEMKTFTDPKGRYRLQYPSSWTLSDKTKGSHMIRADINKDSHTGLQIRLYTNVSRDFEDFVDWYAKQFMDDMKGHWKGDIREIDKTINQQSELKECRVSLSLKRADGQEWFLKQYLWSQDKKIVAIQAGTSMKSRFEEEPALDGIAQTFAFY